LTRPWPSENPMLGRGGNSCSFPQTRRPARWVRDKVVSAADAVRLIRDGDYLMVEGFVGQCLPRN
jgi:hypothetical protein